MSSFSFPDINVWLALAVAEHAHSANARLWWNHAEGPIAFFRLTQIGLLRVLTTGAAMGGKPLSMVEAWNVYDRFFEDERVVYLPEPAGVDARFRGNSSSRSASPKLWADAFLLAFAASTGGTLVTFDRAMAAHGAHCLLAAE